jgi:hypothetical protein
VDGGRRYRRSLHKKWTPNSFAKARTNEPIPVFTTSERASEQLDDLLRGELTLDSLIAASPDTPALTDDRPINEYYLVRKLRHGQHPETD